MQTLKHVEIRPARNGRGVFARTRIKLGQKILPVIGKVFHYTVTFNWPKEPQSNTFRYGPETYLSPQGHISEMLNHSCDPNSKVVKEGRQLYMVAIRPIAANEEVVFDYSTITAPDDIWRMRCNCGTAQCRGRVTSYDRLPKSVLERYRQEQLIPKYILKI